MKQHAHRIPPLPSNVRRDPMPHAREWDRRDPDYDDPPRMDWREMVMVIPGAIIVLVGLWAVCVLLILLVPS